MKAYRMWLFAVGVGVMACSARVPVGDLGDASFDHISTGTGGVGGEGGSGGLTTGTGGSGGTGVGGSGGATTGTGGTMVADARIPADSACAGEAFRAEKQQVDFYMMIDNAGSMDMIDTGQTLSRWDNLAQAIPTFVNDPANVGMEVGVDFFPEGGIQASCNVADYTIPNAPIDFLPGSNNIQANAIISAVQGRLRAGGRPTVPALTGALQIAKAWQMNNPHRSLSVLLLTGGQPTGCQDNTITAAAAVAQMYATGTIPIKTYVLGIGADTGLLDPIAAAGGTTMAYMVANGGNAEIAQTLSAIRRDAEGCEYDLPVLDSSVIDPNKINVNVKFGLSPTRQDLFSVGNAAGCSDPVRNPTGAGWYYDNPPPGVPTKIILCPSTCSPVRAADGSDVTLLFGCQTWSLPPAP